MEQAVETTGSKEPRGRNLAQLPPLPRSRWLLFLHGQSVGAFSARHCDPEYRYADRWGSGCPSPLAVCDRWLGGVAGSPALHLDPAARRFRFHQPLAAYQGGVRATTSENRTAF